MSDAKTWALEIDRDFAAQMGGVRDAVEYLGLYAIKRIVEMSPVGNMEKWTDQFKMVGKQLEWFSDSYVGGRFRGNWTLSFGTPDPTVTEKVDPDGGPTIKKLTAEMKSYPQDAFPVIYLQNNLPYAERLENGYSKQAPNGMVGITYAELAALWEAQKI